MSYTETTTTGYGERLGNSFKGMLLGLALVAAGTGLLWWNEGDFVATRDALLEAQAVTEPISDISKVDPALNGKVIHASGRADTKDVLTDPEFGVKDTAIKMRRNVEYYQWVQNVRTEKRQKVGGAEETIKTYTYEQAWTGAPVNSGSFVAPNAPQQYHNFVRRQVEDTTAYAQEVTFGAYRLPTFLIRSIGGDTPLQVSIPDSMRQTLNQQLHRPAAVPPASPQPFGTAVPGLAGAVANYAGNTAQPNVMVSPNAQMVHTVNNTIYLGPNPGTPSIGDVRISYTVVHPAEVSIIAKVNNGSFERFVASNGKEISRLTMGTKNMEAMFADAHSGNETMTWILRVVGALVIIGGLKMVVAPLATLASVLPFLGSIVGAGTGIVCTLLGLAWSLVIIAIAWLRFRPLLGGAMLGIAVLLIGFLWVRGRGRTPAPQPAGMPQGAPGQAMPGQPVPGQPVPGQPQWQAQPGQAMPGQAMPGQAPWQPQPSQPAPGQAPWQPQPSQPAPGQTPWQPQPSQPAPAQASWQPQPGQAQWQPGQPAPSQAQWQPQPGQPAPGQVQWQPQQFAQPGQFPQGNSGQGGQNGPTA